jgi:hypothetical protein
MSGYGFESARESAWPLQLGIEATPLIAKNSNSLCTDLNLDHLQVSVPGFLTASQTLALSKNNRIVLHSSLLNLFGPNDWKDLKCYARQISLVKPIRVIEHATRFRHVNGAKTGVYFEPRFLESDHLSQTVETFKKWEALLGIPVAIENAPVTEHVDAYFQFMLEIKRLTGCEIVVDVPHFLISAIAAKWNSKVTKSMANALKPAQMHLAGVNASDGRLKDNHRFLTAGMPAFAKEFFPQCSEVTLEQSSLHTEKSIASMCKTIRSCPKADLLLDYKETVPLSMVETNSFLSTPYAPFKSLQTTPGTHLVPGLLERFEKYTPFHYPIHTFQLASSNLPAKDALRSAVDIIKASSTLETWYGSDPTVLTIQFGENEKPTFSKTISEDMTEAIHNPIQSLNFQCIGQSWIRLIESKLTDLKTTKGGVHD